MPRKNANNANSGGAGIGCLGIIAFLIFARGCIPSTPETPAPVSPPPAPISPPSAALSPAPTHPSGKVIPPRAQPAAVDPQLARWMALDRQYLQQERRRKAQALAEAKRLKREQDAFSADIPRLGAGRPAPAPETENSELSSGNIAPPALPKEDPNAPRVIQADGRDYGYDPYAPRRPRPTYAPFPKPAGLPPLPPLSSIGSDYDGRAKTQHVRGHMRNGRYIAGYNRRPRRR